eukprot:TRINITY_DN1002_c0_g2_i1.p1 TRINITY_DN1002_c0_g2~~TRINITY_DN1002_c0_g2_i1.p1  ORF type:complete len:457 (+),score=64.67 TRINITY_DN1002_c0_g2_i1:184-1554(+)
MEEPTSDDEESLVELRGQRGSRSGRSLKRRSYRFPAGDPISQGAPPPWNLFAPNVGGRPNWRSVLIDQYGARNEAERSREQPAFSKEELDNMFPKELQQHCESFGINTKKKREKEIKRLLLQVKVDKSLHLVTNNVLQKAVERHYTQKRELANLIVSVQEFLPGVWPENKLPFGKTKDGLNEQMSDMLAALTAPQCPVLILGDVGSGKSLFINLLLQLKLLPTTSRHCTSTICEIEYSKHRSIILYPHAHTGLETRVVQLDGPPEECKSKLDHYLNKAKINGTNKTSPYSRVVLQWDMPILKHGVVLVDSPGLNDGEHNLDQVVLEYIPKAIAIICIISCENGVTESAKKLIESAMEQEHFDPAALMFVCSKIDKIPNKDKNAVLDDIRKALKSIVRCEPAMFPLSTRGALKTLIKYKFQTPALRDFNTVLDRFLAESYKYKLDHTRTYIATYIHT